VVDPWRELVKRDATFARQAFRIEMFRDACADRLGPLERIL
jgi:hypothetical protein